MTCFICGVSAAVIYVKGMFRDEVVEERAYCRGCFALDDFPEEVKRTFHDFELRIEPDLPQSFPAAPVPVTPAMSGPVIICCSCGSGKSTLRASSLVGNVYEDRDFCEPCFSLAIGRIQRQSALWRWRGEMILHVPFEKLRPVWDENINAICNQHPRFSHEAHALVLKATLGTLAKGVLPSPLGCDEISARRLVQAVEREAVETWGTSARDLLKLWGVETSSDVGDIVFILVEAGLIRQRTPEIRRAFDELPFFEDETGFDRSPAGVDGLP